MVNMMSSDDKCVAGVRKVILVATACRHSATAVMLVVILPKTAPRKLPYQGTPHHHTRSHSHLHHNHSNGDRSQSFFTDTDRGTALTGQHHATDPSTTEAPVTTRSTYPTAYPITTAILITLLQTGTLGDTHMQRYLTPPQAQHIQSSLLTVSLTPATPWELPTECT